MEYGQIGLEVLECGLGVALLYFRFGLWESEEGQLQDAMSLLWISIDDRCRKEQARYRVFVTETVRISQSLLIRFFGSRILSMGATVKSAALAIASMAFAVAVWLAFTPNANTGAIDIDGFEVKLLSGSTLSLAAALVPAWVRSRWALIGPLLVIVAFFVACAWAVFIPLGILLVIGAWQPVLFSIVADILWILMYRTALRWASAASSAWRGTVVLILGAAVAPLSIFAFSQLDEDDSFWMLYPWLFTGARVLVAIVAATQVLVVLTLSAHRILWPLISRAVYALERHEVLKKRRAFGSVGTVLILHSLAGHDLIQSIVRALLK